MSSLEKISYSYLAGFIAGDGCIYTSKSGRTRIIITQRNSEILYTIKSFIGCGGNINPKFQENLYGAGLMYSFEVSAQADVTAILKKISSYMSFERLSLGFIAGFVDADGCLYRQEGKYLTLRIGQKNRKRLEKIQEKFGGKVYPLDRDSNNFPCWITGDLNFIRKLNPYLILKRRIDL